MSSPDRREIEDELGPIDFLVVTVPGGRIGSGGFATLLDLADHAVIQILDLEFATKGDDGSVTRRPTGAVRLGGRRPDGVGRRIVGTA